MITTSSGSPVAPTISVVTMKAFSEPKVPLSLSASMMMKPAAVPAAKLWISVAQEFRMSAPKADPTEALQDMSDEESRRKGIYPVLMGALNLLAGQALGLDDRQPRHAGVLAALAAILGLNLWHLQHQWNREDQGPGCRE